MKPSLFIAAALTAAVFLPAAHADEGENPPGLGRALQNNTVGSGWRETIAEQSPPSHTRSLNQKAALDARFLARGGTGLGNRRLGAGALSSSTTGGGVSAADGSGPRQMVVQASYHYCDYTPSVVTISNAAPVTEGDYGSTNAVFTVRAEPLFFYSGFSVDFVTVDGTATAQDQDYQPREGSVAIPSDANTNFAGFFETTIEIPVFGDTVVEDDETFTVQLSVGPDFEDCVTLQDPTGVGTILNDDEVIVVPATISIDDVQLVEGDTGQTAATFTVTASPLDQVVTVDFATQDGTATTADSDYSSTSGTLTFVAGGQETQTISVPVLGDTRVEGDETFSVVLSNAEGGSVSDGEATATILNDDGNSMVRIVEAAPVAETAGVAEIVVQRDDPSGDPAQVTISASEGTATAGADFTPVTTVLSWGADEGGTRTVRVTILDDNLAEGDETVRVALSSPVEAILASPSQVDLVIQDDDQAGDVEIIGEGELEAVVETGTELMVRVRGSNGNPIQGAQVFWSVDEGEAELESGSPTTTDVEGISRQQLGLSEIPGVVVVRASLASPANATQEPSQDNEESVVFRLRVRGNLDLGSDAERLSVGAVLDLACVEPEGQFAEFCSYLFGLDDEQQRQVVEEATPNEVAAQGNLMLELPQWGFRQVGRRLAALRGGGSRRVQEELAVVFGTEEVQLASIVGAVKAASAQGDSQERMLDNAFASLQEAKAYFASPVGFQDDGEDEVETYMDEEETLPRWGLFLSGRFATAEQDATELEEGFEAGIEGLTIGVDYRIRDSFILGGAASYLTTDLDLDRDGGGLDADGYSLAAYAAWIGEACYVDAVLGYGDNSFDLRRNIDLPAPFQGASRYTAVGSTDGEQVMAGLGFGWQRPFGASSIELFGRGSVVEADIDGYTESGAGPFDLTIGEQSLDSFLTEAGLDYSYAASVSWGVLQPQGRISWLHEFGDDSRLVRGSFVQDVSQLEFVIPTDEPDRDYAALGVGLTLTTYKGRSFYIWYDRDLGRDTLEVGTFTIGGRFEF